MLRQHRILPDAPSGYALLTNRGRSLWSVLEPVGSTNLFLNPSVETALTGYQALTGSETITRDNSRSRRGAWSIKIVTSSSSNRGMVANNGSAFTLTAGITYTLSFDFCGAGAVPYSAYVSGPSSSEPGRIRMIGRGVWQRLTLTFTPSSTGSHNINLLKETSTSTAPFWCDGWQLEALPYATTYVDGDQRGYDVDYYDLTTNTDKPSPYQWLGTPHASQSRRLATTRSGGRRRYLDEFGWSQPSMTGTLQTPMRISDARFANGGGMFQRAVRDIRTLALVGMIIGNPLAQAAQLADLFNPEQGPATLVYQKHEDDEEVYVPAVYQSGLEGDITNEYRLDTPMQFNVYAPITRGYDVSTALNYSVDIPNANAILMRDSAGLWQALGTGFTGTAGGGAGSPVVNAIVRGLDYSYYFAGDFGTVNGTPMRGIARYDGTTFYDVSGGSNGTVNALAIAPDGSLIAGGNGGFGASFSISNLAKWNGATWSSLGSVTGGQVYAVVFGPDGTLYIGGDFTSVAGVANTSKLAKWNGTSWSAVSSSTPNSTVRSIQIDQLNNVYIGGAFTTIGGVSYSRIAMYNATSGAWQALASGVNNTVYAVTFGPDGYLYVGGSFTDAGNGIATWNGSAFQPLGSGVSYSFGTAIVQDISIDRDGRVYIAGTFDRTGVTILPDNMAQWFGGSWRPMDVDTPGSMVASIVPFDDGRVYVGFFGGGTAKSAVTTANNPGTDNAYPTVTFTGPGQIHQLYNYTTGDTIYFSNLVLNSGETATLRISPQGTTFESNFRGSLLSYIGPGSNPSSWKLQQGANNVSSFMTSTTAATSITLTFRVPIGKLT
jgi:hypothetical protein